MPESGSAVCWKHRKRTYHLEGIDLNPAVSMGLALYPSEADSLEALMRLADADMYEHKKRRRCGTGLKRPFG